MQIIYAFLYSLKEISTWFCIILLSFMSFELRLKHALILLHVLWLFTKICEKEKKLY